MDYIHSNYLLRFDELSEGRDLKHWLVPFGVSGPALTRMRKDGTKPSVDTLLAISRAENTSVDWLLYAHGAPFITNNVMDDTDGYRLLNGMLEKTGWRGYLVNGKDVLGYSLVLVRAGHDVVKGKTIDYSIVEIIAGRLGPKTQAEFLNRLDAPKYLKLKPDEFQRLTSGHMGNYELLGWRGEPGLLSAAIDIDSTNDYQIKEPAKNFAELSDSEQLLIQKYRRLSTTAQAQLLTIADTLKS